MTGLELGLGVAFAASVAANVLLVFVSASLKADVLLKEGDVSYYKKNFKEAFSQCSSWKHEYMKLKAKYIKLQKSAAGQKGAYAGHAKQKDATIAFLKTELAEAQRVRKNSKK